jgi:hypothetical protein
MTTETSTIEDPVYNHPVNPDDPSVLPGSTTQAPVGEAKLGFIEQSTMGWKIIFNAVKATFIK